MKNLTLSKLRKANFVIQPIGLNTDKFGELWLQMEFQFDGKRSEVEIKNWWVTNGQGVPVSLSKLSYTEVQAVCEAMAEESKFHISIYYESLESDYYNNVKDAKHETAFEIYRDSRGA